MVAAKLGVDQVLVISYYANFGWECLRNHPDETTLENLEFAGRRSMYIPEFETFWPGGGGGGGALWWGGGFGVGLCGGLFGGFVVCCWSGLFFRFFSNGFSWPANAVLRSS